MATQEDIEYPLYDFMYPKFLVKDLFDVVVQEDDYVERAFHIYRNIGNLFVRHHLTEYTVPDSCVLELPCNTIQIEAVTLNTLDQMYKDYDLTYINHDQVSFLNNRIYLVDALNTTIKNILPQRTTSHAKALGQFIPYEHHGKTITVDEKWKGSKILLLYNGIVADDNGLPCLFRKETEAIAYKLAYLDAQKRSFKGDPIATQQLSILAPQVGRLMQAAAIPDNLSQNFVDRMLSAKTRHDRKVFYNSYKLQQ